MNDRRGGVDPGLWRAVVRPLLREGVERVLYDSAEEVLAERALAASTVTVHAVAPNPGLDGLLPAYASRLFVHASAIEAWEAARACDLAVLDANRQLREHVEVVRRHTSAGGHPPTLLVYGLGSDRRTSAGSAAQDPATALFTEHGWTVLDIPGFEEARIVVPVPGRAVGSRAWSLVEQLESTRKRRPMRRRPGGAAQDQRQALGEPYADELWRQIDDLQRAQDESRIREAVAQEATAVLNATHERVLDQLTRVRADVSALTDELEEARDNLKDLEQLRSALGSISAERDRIRVERNQERTRRSEAEDDRARLEDTLVLLELHLDALNELRRASATELLRVADTQSWRLGHSLARIARVLTFRRPGRTDGLRRVAEQLENWNRDA